MEIDLNYKVRRYRNHYSKEVDIDDTNDLLADLCDWIEGKESKEGVQYTRAELKQVFDTFLDDRDKDVEDVIRMYMESNNLDKIESPEFGKVMLRDEYKVSILKADFRKATEFLKALNPDTTVTLEYALRPYNEAQEEAILSLGVPTERKESIHWKHLSGVVRAILEEGMANVGELEKNGVNVYINKKISVSKEVQL